MNQPPLETLISPTGPHLMYGPGFEYGRSVEYAAGQGPAFYTLLRHRYGDVAPVELAPGVPGFLILTKRAADEVLHDEKGIWSKNQQAWEAGIPATSPILGVFRYRKHPVSHDGAQHQRYRKVITQAFSRLPRHYMEDLAAEVCDQVIDDFLPDGHADLVDQYARLVPLHFINRIIGFPDSEAQRLRRALAGHFETTEDAIRATQEVEQYGHDLLQLKARQPGNDIATWILGHRPRLDPVEEHDHVILTIGAGHEPTSNLIGNAVLRLLIDDGYYAQLSDGVLPADTAIHHVLRDDPPMANHCPHWPTRDLRFYGTDIPAHSIVLTSLTSVNADAAGPGSHMGTRGHYAFGAGPHQCPVRSLAVLLARIAITRLTQRCTNLQTTLQTRAQVPWRQGFVGRGPAHLPATFKRVTAPTARTPRRWRGNPFLHQPAAVQPSRPPQQCPMHHAHQPT